MQYRVYYGISICIYTYYIGIGPYRESPASPVTVTCQTLTLHVDPHGIYGVRHTTRVSHKCRHHLLQLDHRPHTPHQPPCVQKPSQFSLFRAHFSKKMLPSIAMAAADCCAGDKDHATRCRPPARAGVQACRGARASSSKIPVVERCTWRPVHKRKAEDAWSCARRRRRRSCSSRSA